MQSDRARQINILPWLLFVLVILLVTGGSAKAKLEAIPAAYPNGPAGMQPVPPERTIDLSTGRIEFSSPVLGDLDRAPGGDLEIIVGTVDGWIYALKANGSILWSFDTASALNAVAEVTTSTTVRSTPCLQDLDGDGWLEVVVGIGTILEEHENGGVVILDHDGALLPGWPVLTFSVDASGATAGVASSPTAADMDGDGLLEVVFGAFDQRIYVVRLDGTSLPGWPIFAYDTIWSSPATIDLDEDGLNEVITGSDGHDDAYFGLEQGGYLHVRDHLGRVKAGFPQHVPQIVFSSPAIADLDGDGHLDIIVGTGTYYSGDAGKMVFAWDRQGNALSGWPVGAGSHIPGSPALGDLDNNGDLEVVVGTVGGEIRAWHHNGSEMWTTTPRDWQGSTTDLTSPILVDVDGDGQLEVLFHLLWEVGMLDADGTQLTWDGTEPNPGQPTYFTDHSLLNSPAVGDVDGDGTLELVAGGGNMGGTHGRIYIWELASAVQRPADWRMFRKDATHSALQRPAPQYDARIISHTVPHVVRESRSTTWEITVENVGTAPWNGSAWGLSGSNADFTPLSYLPLDSGESIAPAETKTFAIEVDAPSQPGFYTLSWRMSPQSGDAFGALFSQTIKVGQQPALYTWAKEDLNGQRIYPGGVAPELGPTHQSFPWQNAAAMALRFQGGGYYLMTSEGYLFWGGEAVDFGGWGGPVTARDLILGPDGNGLYRLLADGSVGRTVATAVLPGTPSLSDARSLAITHGGRGGYILGAYGVVHRFGSAPALAPTSPAFGSPIAQRIKLTADESGYYVLDAYGRVHAGGAAPAIAANHTIHMGEDWARDLEITEDGAGYYLLDKYGGIHTGGSAVELAVSIPPTWTTDTAVDLELLNGQRLLDPEIGPAADSIWFLLDESGGGISQLPILIDNLVTDETLEWTAQISPTVDWLTSFPTNGVTPGILTLAVPQPLTVGLGIYSTTLILDAELNSVPVASSETTVWLRVVNQVMLTYMPIIAWEN